MAFRIDQALLGGRNPSFTPPITSFSHLIRRRECLYKTSTLRYVSATNDATFQPKQLTNFNETSLLLVWLIHLNVFEVILYHVITSPPRPFLNLWRRQGILRTAWELNQPFLSANWKNLSTKSPCPSQLFPLFTLPLALHLVYGVVDPRTPAVIVQQKNHSCHSCGKRGHWKLVCKSLASAKSVTSLLTSQPCSIKPQQVFLSTSRYQQAPVFTPSNFKWTLVARATQSTNLTTGSSILVQSLPPLCVCSTTQNPSSPQRVKFCCQADTMINSMMLCSKLLHHQSTTLRCLVWPTALAWAYCSLKSTVFTN